MVGEEDGGKLVGRVLGLGFQSFRHCVGKW